MDEPLSHLDDENREKAMNLIREEAELRRAGMILADLHIVPYFKAQKVLQL
jgi:energy-coupling factor transporter ATP-binding protein EcfA2